MRSFSEYHPAALLFYFVPVLLITMFIDHPILLIFSLAGAWFYLLTQNGSNLRKSLWFDLIFFLVITISNPIFNHRGGTLLFFLNGKPVTLEALVYGGCMAVMMLSVIHWCRAFTIVMTSDKLLYLCGKVTPNLSVVLSMVLRYIPLFRIRAQKVGSAQTAMGLYTGEGYMVKTKGSMRIFSIVLTWSLENAIDTADSMKARGYGLGKRSSFHIFRITRTDTLLIILSILLALIIIAGWSSGAAGFVFYPRLSKISASIKSVIIYIMSGLLFFMPVGIELKEKIKWKLYRSGI